VNAETSTKYTSLWYSTFGNILKVLFLIAHQSSGLPDGEIVVPQVRSN